MEKELRKFKRKDFIQLLIEKMQYIEHLETIISEKDNHIQCLENENQKLSVQVQQYNKIMEIENKSRKTEQLMQQIIIDDGIKIEQMSKQLSEKENLIKELQHKG